MNDFLDSFIRGALAVDLVLASICMGTYIGRGPRR